MDTILSYLETNENLTPYVTDLLEDQNMLQLLIDCTKFDFIPLKERSYLEPYPEVYVINCTSNDYAK